MYPDLNRQIPQGYEFPKYEPYYPIIPQEPSLKDQYQASDDKLNNFLPNDPSQAVSEGLAKCALTFEKYFKRVSPVELQQRPPRSHSAQATVHHHHYYFNDPFFLGASPLSRFHATTKESFFF